jgi:hypothetical protein
MRQRIFGDRVLLAIVCHSPCTLHEKQNFSDACDLQYYRIISMHSALHIPLQSASWIFYY